MAETILLTQVIDYARHGWRVFPLHTPEGIGGCSCRDKNNCSNVGKHPRTLHGLKDATTDEQTIRNWWRMWPEANIGLPTGAGFALVLDVDPRHGGDDSLRDLEAQYGALPKTPESLTGGGGRHLLFASPGFPIKNTVNLAPGLDIRGDGGYIVAPPSLHASGRRYEWEAASHYEDIPLAPLPAWLLERLRTPRRQTTTQAEGDPIPDGERNVSLFKLAASMRAKGFTKAAILAALLEENKARCQPPKPEAEVRRIAESAAKYPPGTTTEHPQEEEERYTLTDTGNAERLIDQHGADLHYIHPFHSWYVWQQTHWELDDNGHVRSLATEVIKDIQIEITTLKQVIAKLKDEDSQKVEELESYRKSLQSHRSRSLNAYRLRGMLECATTTPRVPILPHQLDADPWLLNVQNGTLDLRTGTLSPHRREDLLTKVLDIPYDLHAKCPLWRRFLWEVMGGDDGRSAESTGELVDFLQRAVGYTLTGDIREEIFFILWGATGYNGKTTFLNILRALMGVYGKTSKMSTFLEKKNETINNDLAELAGVRFVSAREVGEGKRLSEDLIKTITGRDPIRARFLYKEYFEYQPQYKLWLAVNHKPIIRGTDQAIWRRPKLIPFEVCFKDRLDPQLEEKLRAELSGILTWAVEGCLLWQVEGLQIPGEVDAATEAYRAEMDHLKEFLEECCVQLPDVKVNATQLYQAYQRWGGNLTQNMFGRLLTDRGFTRTTIDGKKFWLGLGLHSEHTSYAAPGAEK